MILPTELDIGRAVRLPAYAGGGLALIQSWGDLYVYVVAQGSRIPQAHFRDVLEWYSFAAEKEKHA